jgi:3-oxosteroid 1-dehydrogenase
MSAKLPIGAVKMTTNDWDSATDFLVVGTGVAGLSAAITAGRNKLDALLIESMDKWGGTTAISGGGLWLPNNPLMIKDRANDSIAEAFAYMQRTVGNPGPWASDERKLAFLRAIPQYVNTLAAEGVQWARAKDYPDYYPDLPGGRVGRALEVKPFNAKKLGAYADLMREGGIPIPVMTDDVWLLSRAWSTPDGFVRGAQLVFRTLGRLALGQRAIGMGGALVSSLMFIIRKRGIPVWLRSPLRELISEDGRIVGAVVEHDGKVLRVRARRGVMLGAGGFASNTEWRERYQGVAGWTAAPVGQLGQGIAAGAQVGGALAMMEDAWWGAANAVPGSPHQGGFILSERSDPWSVVVDQLGARYLNESESYIDFGHHMLEHHKITPAIPSWLVLDHRHRTHFLASIFMVPGAKAKLLAAGELVEAKILPELAAKMQVDQATFLATIQRFNAFAREGVDHDFGRGRTVYDNYYGDPLVKPNPNLGTIERGPFQAVKIYPGDLGTKGGLVTDAHARVLRADGSVIAGLYAAGNATASVMGHTYPGPGSTIAPAGVFGLLGALHAAEQVTDAATAEVAHGD